MSGRGMHGSDIKRILKKIVFSGIVFFLFFQVSVSFLSCSREKGEMLTEYEKEIKQFRARKDSVFKFADWSPLLPEDKKNFNGLKYYPVDPAFKFEGLIIKYDPMEKDTLMGTGGDLRPALKYGYFQFNYKGKSYRLQVYKMLTENGSAEEDLFLGFTDANSGSETYGGGRYVNLIKTGEDTYIVDFNLAYNPYCVYNPRYSCAIPPAENRLPFPVTAGEKLFKEH